MSLSKGRFTLGFWALRGAEQLRILNERVDHTPRMRTDLTESAERCFFLLVQRLWVLQCVDEQWEDLVDERDEVFARYASQQRSPMLSIMCRDTTGWDLWLWEGRR